MTNPTVSVVIPAYNEELRLTPTIVRIAEYFKNTRRAHEIIVVSNCSTDATQQTVARLAKFVPHLRLVDTDGVCGKGAAVKQGIREAKGDLVLMSDADGSVDIAHLDLFLNHIRGGHDVVIGSIELPGSSINESVTSSRRVLGKLAKVLIRLTATPGIYDTQRGFKLFTSQAAREIFPKLTINGFGFDIEVLVLARRFGYRIKEVPVIWKNAENSTVRALDYLISFIELVRIKWNELIGLYAPVGEPAAGG